MDFPFKARVNKLTLGDIFSFSESEYPSFYVIGFDEEKIYYTGNDYATTRQSMGKKSERIVLILGVRVVKTMFRYLNKKTGVRYKTIQEASKDTGVCATLISKCINGKRKVKIDIEKILPY